MTVLETIDDFGNNIINIPSNLNLIANVNLAADLSYSYYSTLIGPIPLNENGKRMVHNNEVDAWRHAFVSGYFTIKYGESVASILGIVNEIKGEIINAQSFDELNMDMFNNEVGREYASHFSSVETFVQELANVLKRGELTAH